MLSSSAPADHASKLDGMSPLAPIAIRLPDALAPQSIPTTTKDSLDPFATLGLFDIDPASPERGTRVPFDALLRDETNVDKTSSHCSSSSRRCRSVHAGATRSSSRVARS
ncbi:MAG TPA: hypothetical protein VH062_23305 [Polyangiaceae bacterium]|nr:hypothetical protein [Polyangiaceae bacterium]